MVGNALCNYLQAKLPRLGIQVPFFCNKYWGWLLHTKRYFFRMGVCIYAFPDAAPDPERYALRPSIQAPRQWSWSWFRWIDHSQDVMEIIDALEKIFTSAPSSTQCPATPPTPSGRPRPHPLPHGHQRLLPPRLLLGP